MGDYFAHWLAIGETPGAELPRIFTVNWFRRGPAGELLWPGFGDNARVLRWVLEVCDGTASGRETPIGLVPEPGSLDLTGLDITDDQLTRLLAVDPTEWAAELAAIEQHFSTFGHRLPARLAELRERLAHHFG
jgi:phosphoenolpyruvate carboxykinase (GTP)